MVYGGGGTYDYNRGSSNSVASGVGTAAGLTAAAAAARKAAKKRAQKAAVRKMLEKEKAGYKTTAKHVSTNGRNVKSGKASSGRKAITTGKEVARRSPSDVAKRGSSGKGVARRGGNAVARTKNGSPLKGIKAAKRWGKGAGVYGAIIAGSAAAAEYGLEKQEEKNKKGYYIKSGGIGASGYGIPKYEYRGEGSKAGSSGTKKNRDRHERKVGLGEASGKANMKFGSSIAADEREVWHGNKSEGEKYRPPKRVNESGLKAARQRRNAGGTSIYTAGAGDTYEKIAKEAGLSAAELRKANPWMQKHHGRNVIYRNSKIRIPGKTAAQLGRRGGKSSNSVSLGSPALGR